MYLRTCPCPICSKRNLFRHDTGYVGHWKKQAEQQNIHNIRFVQGDAQALPFSENSFDIVISRLAFHHFSNPHRCFEEMIKVLKPNGKLVLIDMEAAIDTLRDTEDEIETLRAPSHVRNLSKDEFLELFHHHLTVQLCDCTAIPVSLTAWLALTHTYWEKINGISLSKRTMIFYWSLIN